MDRNIAIIPARGGSTRIPQKNFFDFFGKPMFVHTYDAAVESGLFEDVVVSTDSTEILDICRNRGIPVPFVRPDSLGADTSSLNDVLMHVLDEMGKRGKSYDNLCLLWATAPMRKVSDIRNAYALLTKHQESDAVISVTDCFQYYPAHINDESGHIQPLVLKNMTVSRTQDVPRTYVDTVLSLGFERVHFAVNETGCRRNRAVTSCRGVIRWIWIRWRISNSSGITTRRTLYRPRNWDRRSSP